MRAKCMVIECVLPVSQAIGQSMGHSGTRGVCPTVQWDTVCCQCCCALPACTCRAGCQAAAHVNVCPPLSVHCSSKYNSCGHPMGYMRPRGTRVGCPGTSGPGKLEDSTGRPGRDWLSGANIWAGLGRDQCKCALQASREVYDGTGHLRTAHSNRCPASPCWDVLPWDVQGRDGPPVVKWAALAPLACTTPSATCVHGWVVKLEGWAP